MYQPIAEYLEIAKKSDKAYGIIANDVLSDKSFENIENENDFFNWLNFKSVDPDVYVAMMQLKRNYKAWKKSQLQKLK